MAIYGEGIGVKTVGGRYKQMVIARIPWGEEKIQERHQGKWICRHPGCRTILSKYNGGWYCAVHEGEKKSKEKMGVATLLGRKPFVKKGYKKDG